jgi:uncharacterized protein (DUF1778 family)
MMKSGAWSNPISYQLSAVSLRVRALGSPILDRAGWRLYGDGQRKERCMAMSHTHISASVSHETKRWLDQCAQARAVSKSDLVESALRHHLQALHDLPADVIIPPRVVVSRKSGERILARIKTPPKPTVAMKALFTRGRSAPAEPTQPVSMFFPLGAIPRNR